MTHPLPRSCWAHAVAGLFILAGATLLATPCARAEFVQVTYAVAAGDFRDSNGNPPIAPASASVEGIYTFTFDTTVPQQNNVVPDAVSGLDITASNGLVIDYDTANSGVNLALNPFSGSGRITLGGVSSTVAFMVGLSNDFRVTFDISLVDFSVANVFENFTFVTVADAFYVGQDTSVTLIDVMVAADADGDGVADAADNCVLVANAPQRDTDADNIGNACDADFNQDCTVNALDLGAMRLNFFDSGDLDTDLDGDGSTNAADLGLLRGMFFTPPGPSGISNPCGQ